MNQEEEKRVQVSALLDAEICQAEIALIAGVGIRTVQHIAAAKRSGTFSAKRKHGSGRYQPVSAKEFISAPCMEFFSITCSKLDLNCTVSGLLLNPLFPLMHLNRISRWS